MKTKYVNLNNIVLENIEQIKCRRLDILVINFSIEITSSFKAIEEKKWAY